MAKDFGKCELCKSMKLLNFAGLCKRCNQMAESSKIVEEAMNKKQKKLAAQKEMQGQRLDDEHERQTLLEKDELTTRQKEKLLELSPDIETMAELEKMIEEKYNKKDAEKKDGDTDSGKNDKGTDGDEKGDE